MRYPYGKNILITGGSSGIGAACAAAFAKNGFTVYACARTKGRAVKSFPGAGQVIPLEMDVTDEASVEEAVSAALDDAGDIGIVLHCAGIGIAGAAEDTLDEAAHRQMEVNYFGVLRVNRHMLPHMRQRGGGLVLVTGSVAGIFAIPFQSHYSAGKFALEAYARALRMETKNYGIRVCLIEPGDTATGFTAARRFAMPVDSPYEQSCRRSVGKMEQDERSGRSPDSVGEIALRLTRRKNPPVFRIVGTEYCLLVFLRRLLPERLVLFLLGKMYIS